MPLRQRSFRLDRRLDAENHLVEHLSWKVLRREGRERVHVDTLLRLKSYFYALKRLSKSAIGEPLTMIETGARAGELRGLRLGDFDL